MGHVDVEMDGDDDEPRLVDVTDVEEPPTVEETRRAAIDAARRDEKRRQIKEGVKQTATLPNSPQRPAEYYTKEAKRPSAPLPPLPKAQVSYGPPSAVEAEANTYHELIGEYVLIHGLSDPRRNGRVGCVFSFDVKTGRAGVSVDGEKRLLSIKPSNLKVVDDAPGEA